MAELKILLPTDGTDLVNAAADMAVELVNAAGGRITVLHVIDSDLLLNIKDGGDAEDAYRTIKRRAQEAVDAAVERCGDVNVRGMILEGEPKKAIIDVSKDYTMIVIGTAGKKDSENTLLGSIADGVLKDSVCPVITVKN